MRSSPMGSRRSTRRRPARQLSILAVTSVCIGLALPVPEASAQFFDFGYSDSYSKPRKKKQRTQTSRPKPSIAEAEQRKLADAIPPTVGPLVLSVSLRKQRVAVYDANGLVTEAPISSGRVGNATPTGVFSILEKKRMHYSNLYHNAPMPNMQRITWSGVALHAGELPGYPASHGCIRLPHAFSKRLFEMTKMGARVIVSNDPVEPQPLRHEALFAAHPVASRVAHAVMPVSVTRVANAGETGSINSVIGVSSATAAPVEAAPSISQRVADLRANRKGELARLEADIATALAKKQELTEAAKADAAMADARHAALKIAKNSWQVAAQNEKKARQALADAEANLAKFARRILKMTSVSAERGAVLQSEEDQLETKVLDLNDAVAQASREAKIASDAMAEAERLTHDADAKRRKTIAELSTASDSHAKAIEADAAAKRREAKRNHPVHVFISRKTGKIYARQGYEPILESPVTITNPDQPIGTHVYTALIVDPVTSDVSWNVASVPTLPKEVGGALPKEKAKREAMLELERSATIRARTEQTAERALSRVSIPDEIRAQIEDVMKPGSSIIISDNGASNETGKYTDFIVSVR